MQFAVWTADQETGRARVVVSGKTAHSNSAFLYQGVGEADQKCRRKGDALVVFDRFSLV